MECVPEKIVLCSSVFSEKLSEKAENALSGLVCLRKHRLCSL
ncbi:hypothetical protein SAMN02910262_00919, partial [[Clostridium] aminophilum]